MKIRIENNNIRVRLTKREVESFDSAYKIDGLTVFGPALSQRLHYTLIKDTDIDKIQSSFESQVISIRIPARLVTKWMTTELITLEERIAVTNDHTLHLIIEKDLKRRSSKYPEDPDAYPHPLERK